MTKILKKIAKIFSTIIFSFLCVLIALIFIYVIRISYLTSQNRIGELKFNFYTILTNSMHPTIDAGDIILTMKSSDNIYKKGDIITFVSTANNTTGITVTHRVNQVVKEDGVMYYKTKGDNNNAVDSNLIPATNVFGKVILTVPKAGYLQQWLVTRTGWIIALIVPCVAVIIYDILKMLKIINKKDKYIKKHKDRRTERYVIETDTKEKNDNGSVGDTIWFGTQAIDNITKYDNDIFNNEVVNEDKTGGQVENVMEDVAPIITEPVINEEVVIPSFDSSSNIDISIGGVTSNVSLTEGDNIVKDSIVEEPHIVLNEVNVGDVENPTVNDALSEEQSVQIPAFDEKLVAVKETDSYDIEQLPVLEENLVDDVELLEDNSDDIEIL